MTSLSLHNRVIRDAIRDGATVDLETGEIFNKHGQKLTPKIYNREPHVRLRDPETKKRYMIRAARIVGYVAFGPIVFNPEIGVSHIYGDDKTNVCARNLTLVRHLPNNKAVTTPMVTTETLIAEKATEKATAESVLDKKYFDLLIGMTHEQEKLDEADRSNPYVRASMVLLIKELSGLIKDYSYGLARQITGEPVTPFEADEAANLLAWQLLEFLGQGPFPRNDEIRSGIKITRGHQLSTTHAENWFNVKHSPSNEALLFADDKLISMNGFLVNVP